MNGNLIQFKGELNEELVKDLKDLILAKQDFPEEVILDLTELEGIGVMGIQIILAVRENLMKNKSGFRKGLVIPVQFGCISSVFFYFSDLILPPKPVPFCSTKHRFFTCLKKQLI